MRSGWTRNWGGLGVLWALAACDVATAPAGVEPGGAVTPLVSIAHAGISAIGASGSEGARGPVLVVGQPSLVGATTPAARSTPAPTPTPTPKASPSPSPTPRPLEFDLFLVRVPPGWTVGTAATRPVNLRLTPDSGPGAFWVMEEDGAAFTLEERQAQARAAAGDGFVAQSSLVLDEVRGYQVNSNQETAQGKRYVVERGFLYRGRFWRVVSEWDKRTAEATVIAQDVAALLKGWRWL